MTTSAMLDVNSLPDDPVVLKQTIRDLHRYIENLHHAIHRLQRWQFGTKAERVPSGQLIFAFYGTLESAKPETPAPAPRARRSPRRDGVRVLPPDLPQETTDLDLSPGEKACPGCGSERELIDWEITRFLDYHPASFFERVFRRAKYACLPCGRHLKTAPLPAPLGPIEKGLPGFGLVAHVVTSKYCDHIPLYRQSKIYARQGVEIPRSTLCDWVRQAVELLAPIAAAIALDVRRSRILRTDDTVVRLLVRGKGRTAQARLWGYLGDAHHNQVAYEFTPDRREEHAQRYLKDFRGLVQADAYKGYDKLFALGSGRIELGCMAHARRYFFDARDSDPERVGIAIGFIRILYEVEARAAPMSPEDRRDLRRRDAAPILKDFKDWLDVERFKMILPESPLGAAFQYALNQWDALTRYVEDGEASIDNNAMERALRGVAIGRKNYMFVGSQEGGRWAAVAYTLIESCKLNGVDPYRYLRDVLRRVWTHPASRIEELMPRLWKPEA